MNARFGVYMELVTLDLLLQLGEEHLYLVQVPASLRK